MAGPRSKRAGNRRCSPNASRRAPYDHAADLPEPVDAPFVAMPTMLKGCPYIRVNRQEPHTRDPSAPTPLPDGDRSDPGPSRW